MSIKSLFVPTRRNKYEAILLKKGMLLVYTLLFFVINYVPGIFPKSFSQVSASSITSSKLIELTNADRERFGLTDLKGNANLTSAAYAKANDILEKQYWDHYGPNGETPWQFIRGAGYDYVYAGENLAKGFKTAEGIHQAWMASTTHRENILSGDYQDIGIAVVSGTLIGEDIILVVQMFGNLTDVVEEPLISIEGGTYKGSTVENGDIKSIKITSPKKDEVVTESKAIVEGGVTGFSNEELEDGGYTVEVNEDGSLIGKTIITSNKWIVEGYNDWAQGSHLIKASLVDSGIKFEDSLVFSVDSVPPIVYANSVSFEDSGDSVKISVAVQDPNPTVSFVTTETYPFVKDDNGKYVLEIPLNKVKDRGVIMATDIYGNSAEVDVSDLLVAYRQRVENLSLTGFVRAIGSKIPSMTPRDWINTVLVLFVLALLIIEIYYYWKNGKLLTRIYSFFIVGIWAVLLVARTVVGFGGHLGGTEALSISGEKSIESEQFRTDN